MTVLASLAYPNGKTLAAWWRQVEPRRPTAFWVGHLFLNRVEALVQMERSQTLQPLAQLTLEAMALEERNPATDTAAQLVRRLHLPEAICRAVVRELRDAGLVAGPRSALTPQGHAALRQGHYTQRLWQRRQFLFLESLDAEGARLGSPRPLPESALAGQPWQHGSAWSHEILQTLVDPASSAGICGLANETTPDGVPNWQRVTLVRPERVMAALSITGETASVFSAPSETAALHSAGPEVELPNSAFTELATPLDASDLLAAWRHWAQQRRLVSPHMDGCTLTLEGIRLEIKPPPLLLQELRVRGLRVAADDWVLVGARRLRRACQVHIVGL